MLEINIIKNLYRKKIHVHMEIGREIVAIVGASGAGKTTLLNLIAGIDTADEGYVRYKQSYWTKNNQRLVSIQNREVGYMFQNYALFPHKTVWENISYSMKNEPFTRDLIEALHMETLLSKYPHEISGGEKQRVAMLRAYAMQPKILLLDEPFSALDQETKQKSIEQLLLLHKKWKIPVLFITHDLLEIDNLTNRVYELKDGYINEIANNI